MKKPVVLIIMDGWGLAPDSDSNSVSVANTPNYESFLKRYPNIKLNAQGASVGLPEGQMGNSEVGHLNIGAGRIVWQSLSRINNSIEEGSFAKNKTILKAIEHAKVNNSKLHIIGLLSDGGVHSHQKHIVEVSKIVKEAGLKKVFIHAMTDGRDVGQKSAKDYFSFLAKNNCDVASISGRYYAMDRDKRWERSELAYNMMLFGDSNSFNTIDEYISNEYSNKRFDEFFLPSIQQKKEGLIEDNDAVIFINFRPDRARQLSHLLIGTKLYDHQPKQGRRNNLYLATMMKYDGVDCDVIFPLIKMNNLLGEIISNAGLSQLRAAETEKYPHVTFFLDGGVDKTTKGEGRILVNSPDVATYDLQPEMSQPELTKKILAEIGNYDTAIINFANADMVGHSGDIEATAKACEAVDKAIGELHQKIVEELGGVMLITADHGNADVMRDEKGEVVTKHSTNPVPLIITDMKVEFKDDFCNSIKGKLGDLAPTMLKILGLKQPSDMTGKILIK